MTSNKKAETGPQGSLESESKTGRQDLVDDGVRLAELENAIGAGMHDYGRIGEALIEIRDKRLYRAAGYPRFDDYCRERWGWKSKQTAYNYIAAAEVTAGVQTSGLGTPSFSQAVELATLPAAQLEEALEAIGARGQTLESMTVRDVRDVVQEVSSAAVKRDNNAASVVPDIPICVTGDLWLLNEHRLLVGNAIKQEEVSRLMAGDLANLVFIDPPYNVAYSGKTEQHLTIEGDRMSDGAFRDFLAATFQSCRSIMEPDASLYVCHPSSYQRDFQNALDVAGLSVRCQIVWVKDTFVLSWGRYKHHHEPIFYCHLAGHTDRWYGDDSQSTAWFEKKPTANRLHPTMKPVELVARAIRNSSVPRDIVADLFGGSGSALIACERHGRRARIMEIDARYADVIVRRWEREAGSKAILDGDGRTFDEIKQVRHPIPYSVAAEVLMPATL